MDAERKIINYLKDRGEVLQSRIHKDLGLSKSTVSEILKRLEKEGKIVRERVAGRSYRIWYFEHAPKPVEGIVRIGILRASEYPHILLSLRNLDIKAYIRVFDSALDLTKALSSYRIDIGFSPFITQTVFALLLKSIKIHRIVAFNGSGIVYKKDLRSCKTFATSEFSAMESNLKLSLEKLGHNLYDLNFRYFNSIGDAIKSFKSCEFDAIAVWEPYFTLLGYYKIPFRDIIGDYPCCSMASNLEFYKRNKTLIQEFIRCIEDSVELLNYESRRISASKYLAREIGLNWRIVLKSFKSYKFSCKLDFDNFKFLENYGLKLTRNSIKTIADIR